MTCDNNGWQDVREAEREELQWWEYAQYCVDLLVAHLKRERERRRVTG